MLRSKNRSLLWEGIALDCVVLAKHRVTMHDFGWIDASAISGHFRHAKLLKPHRAMPRCGDVGNRPKAGVESWLKLSLEEPCRSLGSLMLFVSVHICQNSSAGVSLSSGLADARKRPQMLQLLEFLKVFLRTLSAFVFPTCATKPSLLWPGKDDCTWWFTRCCAFVNLFCTFLRLWICLTQTRILSLIYLRKSFASRRELHCLSTRRRGAWHAEVRPCGHEANARLLSARKLRKKCGSKERKIWIDLVHLV